VTQPSFVVPLADLERGPRELSWPLTPAWLTAAFEGTDAEPREPGVLEVTLTKNGQDVLVRGRLRAAVRMPDAATLDPVDIDIDTEVFLMLAPAPTPPGGGRGRRAERGDAKRSAQKKGKKGGWEHDPELTDGDAARDTYSGEQIVLDTFAREFLLLELPIVARKDLRSGPPPAIAPPSPAPAEEAPRQVDPRLAPLAAIAQRMRDKKV
jgi:uncharacterized protein